LKSFSHDDEEEEEEEEELDLRVMFFYKKKKELILELMSCLDLVQHLTMRGLFCC
jgi:hypothetical protein